MLWLLFLLAVFLNGLLLVTLLAPTFKRPKLPLYASIFTSGSLVSMWSLYLVTSYITHDLSRSLTAYFAISCISVCALFIKRASIPDLKPNLKIAIFLIISFVGFYWFFNKGFSYDIKTSEFLISSNTYLDFGAHLPLMRSFSMGNNFPMEVPFYAGGNVVYHFMFYLFAAVLEHIGLQIDKALNFLSALSFALVLGMIYEVAVFLFKKRSIGILSATLFLLPSNLSIVSFLQSASHASLLKDIYHNSAYYTAGPLGKDTVGVFWQLNTYLNQRHFIFGLLVFLLLLYFLLAFVCRASKQQKKTNIFWILIIGLLPLWHTQVEIGVFILGAGLWYFFKEARSLLQSLFIPGFLLSIPQMLRISSSQSHILLRPGFLLYQHLTMQNVIIYWFWNIGLLLFLLPLIYWQLDKDKRRIFVIFMLLFVAPNLFRFGSDMFDNHKLLNMWILCMNIFVAWFLVKMWNTIVGKVASAVLVILFIASGVVNIFVVKNDVYTRIPDYSHSAFLTWAKTNIPNNTIIFTNGEIYDPLNIVGKKTYLGRVHYLFLYGEYAQKRINNRKALLDGSVDVVPTLLKKEHIEYVVLYPQNAQKNIFQVQTSAYSNFPVQYHSSEAMVYKIP